MTLKLNRLATAVTFAFATAATAQTAPATTQTTTTQTQPAASQTPPAATTPTTTQTTTTTSQLTKATAADIKAGASVYDETGALVGKLASVNADGAIVNTGKVRAQIPLSSFGKNAKGLVVSATKASFDAQAKKGAKTQTKTETKTETKVETKPKS